MYRGQVNPWDKGLVLVFFLKLHNRGERGEKGGECKYQNKEHIPFDPRISLSPVLNLIELFNAQKCTRSTQPQVKSFLSSLSAGNRKCIERGVNYFGPEIRVQFSRGDKASNKCVGLSAKGPLFIDRPQST